MPHKLAGSPSSLDKAFAGHQKMVLILVLASSLLHTSFFIFAYVFIGAELSVRIHLLSNLSGGDRWVKSCSNIRIRLVKHLRAVKSFGR